MIVRARPASGVLAAALLLTLWVPAGPATAGDAGPASGDLTQTAVAAGERQARPALAGVRPLRLRRLLSRIAAPVAPWVLAAIALAADLVGRTRRRLGDVGDDWRSLLVGAPPARA